MVRGDETLDHLVRLDGQATVPPNMTVAGRYRLDVRLGAGAFGVVYGAVDELNGDDVAIKLLAESDQRASPRVGREIDALRTLHIPGVVRLLDEGTLQEPVFGALTRYIVMERVPGVPFPGRAGPHRWEDLAARVAALLECLARVHDAGVVHRDLKPANVLVDEDGRPMLLDFGLARGERLGGTITAADALVGTPRYLAPEQALHEGTDGRADLYSLGAMVYEALSGRVPLEDLSQRNLLSLRLTREATPLAVVARDTPREAAAWVDRLVRRDREERFPSAVAALQALRAFWEDAAQVALPTLGADADLGVLLGAVERHEVAVIAGPRGSGRTRLLSLAAAAMREAGRVVTFLSPGKAPFESFGTVIGELAESQDRGLLEMVPAVEERVARLAGAGVVLVADDAELLDRWTRAAMESISGRGSALLVFERHPAPTVTLGPVPEVVLRELFCGPDRILHLREDGAHELWRRTGGLLARVEAEVAAWVRAGLATWQEDRLQVSRSVLDGMRLGVQLAPVGVELTGDGPKLTDDEETIVSWIHLCGQHASAARLAHLSEQPAWRVEGMLADLETRGAVRRRQGGVWAIGVTPQGFLRWSEQQRASAYAGVAATLEPGAEGRLLLLLLASDASAAAAEAMMLSKERIDAGRTSDAIAVVRQTLLLARDSLTYDEENALLLVWAHCAAALIAAPALIEARHALARARQPSPLVAEVDALFSVWVQIFDRSADEVIEAVSRLQGIDDPSYLELRWELVLTVAQRLPVASHRRLLEEAEAVLAQDASPSKRRWVANVRGQLEYRCCNYQRAAEYHQQAAEGEQAVARRLAGLGNAAAALLEASEFARAHQLGLEVLETSRRIRNAHYEARGEVLARAAAVRGGLVDQPDEDLLPALLAEGTPTLVAFHAFFEAVFFQRRDPQRAAEYAALAATNFESLGWISTKLASCAIAVLCTGPHPAAEVAPRMAELADGTLPGLDFQSAALLWRATTDPPLEWADEVRRLAEMLPPETWGHTREIISVAEGLSWLESDDAGESVPP